MKKFHLTIKKHYAFPTKEARDRAAKIAKRDMPEAHVVVSKKKVRRL